MKHKVVACIPTKNTGWLLKNTLKHLSTFCHKIIVSDDQSVDDTEEILRILKIRFPKIHGPSTDDICYATTNRQLAVKSMAKVCNCILVIGSNNSSNI